MENKRFFIVSAAVLAVGIVLSGLSISFGIKTLKADQRTVSVRGLSEQEVEADLAVWPATFTVSGNDLSQLRQDIVKKSGIITSFLKKLL